MMMAEQTLQDIGRALRETSAVDFVRASLKAGYQAYFPEQAADRLVDDSLDQLAASQAQGVDAHQLADTASRLGRLSFHHGDASFWFNRVYHHYKTELKPQVDFEQLDRLIAGRRVLDYGCGSGYLAHRLARGGYTVLTTDVLDYRYPEARDLPFVKLASPSETPYGAGSADTALVQAVLHHVHPPDLPAVIRGLARMAVTVLIKEDTYDLPADLPGLVDTLARQPLLQAFLALPRETQFQALVVIDFFANVIAQGVSEMNLPFGFRPVPDWQSLLAANGLPVTRVIVSGFEPGRMHQSCHVWLVCRRGPDGAGGG